VLARSKRFVMIGSLCAAGLFAAWLSLRSTLVHAGRFTDGSTLFDPGSDAAVRFAVWDAPVPVEGSVNSPAAETRPALARDARSIVFAVGERGLNMDLYLAEFEAGASSEPRSIEVLNTGADECAPTWAGDDLYFASDRMHGAGGLDLYRSHWDGNAFTAPERLDAPINSPADDCDPALRPGTEELVFASNRDGQGFDLFRVNNGANTGAPRIAKIESLATSHDERDPAFSSDGRALFFASDRECTGSFDLWRSFAGQDGWLDPTALDSLNSDVSERGPSPTADGFTLYFTREVPGRASDVVRARTLELYRLPALPIAWVDWAILGSLLALALMAYLAERWPGLDTIYKCFLVSVLVHIALLLWFRSVLLEGRGVDEAERSGLHRVRLIAPPNERMTERDGRLRTQRAAADSTELVPERIEIARSSGAEPAPPSDALLEAVGAPLERAASAPDRAPGKFLPSERVAARESIELDAGEAPSERRGGDARELALAPSSGGRRAESADAGEPTRAEVAHSGSLESESPGGLDIPVARAPSARAPARSAATKTDALRARSGELAVALASPSDDAGEGSVHRGGSAPGLALDGLAGGASSSRRSEGAEAVERFDAPSGSAVPPALSAFSSGVAPPAPPATLSGPRARDATSLAPQGTGHNPLVLQDREAPTSRIGGTRESDVAGPDRDLLASLAPAAAGRSDRASETDAGAAPERFATPRFADGSGRIDTAPALEIPIAPPTADRESPVAPPRSNWEHTPYRNRAGEEKARALELHGGSAETEQAVERGLAYLARIQRPGGEWGDMDALDDKYGQIAVGKTGLALLAFLGAGHTHVSNTVHSPVVERALDALLGMLDPESGHFGDTEAYSHGIGTFAIAECLALSRDERLRAPLQAAVAHILEKQSKKRDPRFFGGWGYFYSDAHTFDRWPRTSITVWQVMALESARLSGVQVPDTAFDAARQFLDNARDDEGEYYRYNHDPARLGSGYPTLPASTPAALFALSLLGDDIQAQEHAAQRAFVLNRAPQSYRYTTDDAFVHRAQGNLYFWYYGTLAMFRAGGGAWASWNEAMKKTLLPAQDADGSWRPIDIYARYARDNDGDRSYTTAMCVLSLEIYYRYFLPLLKVR
jgi:hypothetical protein